MYTEYIHNNEYNIYFKIAARNLFSTDCSVLMSLLFWECKYLKFAMLLWEALQVFLDLPLHQM